MARPPEILLNDAARDRLVAGASRLARVVAPTYGPTAKTVLFERRHGKPEVSRNGAFIAQRTDWSDPVESLGLKMVRAAACRTQEEVGDGSVTAILLVDALLRAGQAALQGGIPPRTLAAGLRRAGRTADAALGALSRPLGGAGERLSLVQGMAEGEDLATRIDEAVSAVGADGLVLCRSASGREDRLDIRPGMQIETPMLRESFMQAAPEDGLQLEDAWVLIHEAPLEYLDTLVPILEKVLDTGRPLVIFSEEIAGEALASLEVNMREGVMRCLPVKVPGFGARRRGLMEDIACVTGGRVIARATGEDLRKIGLEDLGRVATMRARWSRVDLLDGAGSPEQIASHKRSIDHQIETTHSPFDREMLEQRRARLGTGMALLYVAGADETSARYRRESARKAVRSLQAAEKSGTVPGVGAAYVMVIADLETKQDGGALGQVAGTRLLAQALERPTRQVAENIGLEPGWACQMLKDGISVSGLDGPRDATDVARVALREAISCAAQILDIGGTVARTSHPDETELMD